MSGENIESKAAKLAQLQAEHDILEAEVHKANKDADTFGTDADREYAITQMNLLFGVRERLDALETEVEEAQEEYEASSAEDNKTYSRDYNLGFYQGSTIILGAVLVIGFIGMLVGW